MAPDENVIDSESVILSVIEKARDCAWKEGMVDLSLCYGKDARPENKRFIRQNNIQHDDVHNALGSLRIEDYSETSKETGKTDAYVFGIEIDEGLVAYFKITFRSDVLVLSLHDPIRSMDFPYRRKRS